MSREIDDPAIVRFGPDEGPTLDPKPLIRRLTAMHDAKNRPLKVGYRVLIPAVVTELHATADYCNVTVETAVGRRPDGKRERISAINTGVLLRSNPDDANRIDKWATTEGRWLDQPGEPIINQPNNGFGVNDPD